MALTEEEHELWRRYHRDGDVAARDFLFETYAPWARRIAGNVYRRIRVPQMEWADFAQNASIGLLEAMARFDPERQLDFMAYAKLRVQGAAFNGARIFLTGVDRGVRPDRFGERLEHLSEHTEGSGDALATLIDIVAGLGIGFLLETSGPTQAEELKTQVEQAQLGTVLSSAMETLTEKERIVMIAHYQNHMPFVEIGLHLRITKGRISQLHKAALQKLHAVLGERSFDRDAWL